MAKNIVLCLDGTGNQVGAKGNTNVVRLYEMLDLRDPESQIAFYDPGVGTFSAQGALTPLARRSTRLLGLAVGYGIRANLAEAYTYLMRTYEPGDRIYIFGFSRGAYTARALCGMLHRAGLLTTGAENLVPYAIQAYARSKQKWTENDWKRIDKFAHVFAVESSGSRSVPIHFLGIWDSVKAAGILRWNLKWPYTRQLPNVQTVRHAVSIDEKRRPYEEYLVYPKDDKPELREVWFAGVHSDVGGTFEDDPRLADVSLKWMTDHALEAGLLVNKTIYRRVCALTREHALGKIHRMGRVWILLTYRRRSIVPAGALVHESVRIRLEVNRSYEPKGIGGSSWDDRNWLTLRDWQ
jgi:uncharacterized protein (DUF2235 family)